MISSETYDLLNLSINIGTGGLMIYIAMRIMAFMRFSREHLDITKRYVDLLDTERGRLTEAVHENAAQTRRTFEEKVGEIKQEIRQSAADTKIAHDAERGSDIGQYPKVKDIPEKPQ